MSVTNGDSVDVSQGSSIDSVQIIYETTSPEMQVSPDAIPLAMNSGDEAFEEGQVFQVGVSPREERFFHSPL